MANPFAKKEICGYQTLFREFGYNISRLEQYAKSLTFFDQAIQKTPDDKRALTGRARARTKVSQYEGALDDVNKALQIDPEDLIILADRCENTYLCSEFEKALLQNVRLIPKRTKPECFVMGQMQCSDAIENCLGVRAGRPLRDHFKIIRAIAWKKHYSAQKSLQPKPRNKPKKKLHDRAAGSKGPPHQVHSFRSRTEVRSNKGIRDSLHSLKNDDEQIPKFRQFFPFKPLQHYTSNIENYMAEKYLDKMYLDKIFLRSLPLEQGAASPNKEGSEKIRNLARNCFKTVSSKQEVLRTRRPVYFIKYQEARSSGALAKRQKFELEAQQRSTQRDAEAILLKLNTAYENKELRIFLELMEKLINFIDSKPKKLLPDKSKYYQEIYDKASNAFYDVYRVQPDQPKFIQQKRIYGLLGLQTSREPSSDSVLNQFKQVFVDYQKRIKTLIKKLEYAIMPQEICWYYHEMARFELELKHHDLSRFYAKKCKRVANSLENSKWTFNSAMLVLRNNIAERNKNDAKNDLASAKEFVLRINDDEKLEFLNLCEQIVADVEFEDMMGAKQLEKRQERIIQMMTDSKMKEEVAHLFRQMSALPASRRLTVMPGVKEVEKGSKRSRTLSIMPKRSGVSFKPSTMQDIIEFQ